MTFLAHEHIFDAAEMMSFLAHEHIFDATEMMPFLAHEHIFDATENWGGVGMMAFLAHEHIFDATEMMSFLAHEHIFAAAALHRKPGVMMSVLNALQLYRNDCSSGKICVAPKDAFDPDSLSWLAYNGKKSFSAFCKIAETHFG